MAANSRATAPSAIHVENPEETVRAFQDAFRVFISAPRQAAAGSEALRETFAGFLAAKPRFELKIMTLYPGRRHGSRDSEWKLEGTDSEGNVMALSGRCAATLRRQADGRWLYASKIRSPSSNRLTYQQLGNVSENELALV